MQISFVLLTWNRSNLLENCINELVKSIHNYKECEIIIMNNCSTDNTKEVMQRLVEKHKGVNIICKNRKKNYGLNSYKRLFWITKGKIIVELDDDVLSFPDGVDNIFRKYFNEYKDYGYLALDVIQNEFTDGAKLQPERYMDDKRGDLIVQEGPTGGWCAGIRRSDLRKIWLEFYFTNLTFQNAEDGVIRKLVRKKLKKRCGILKNQICFHATGPHYASIFGTIEREIEKYSNSNLLDYVERYKSYRDKND